MRDEPLGQEMNIGAKVLEEVGLTKFDTGSRHALRVSALFQAAVHAFVDQRLADMWARPDMWGGPDVIEGLCLNMIETYEMFGRSGPIRFEIRPHSSFYMALARQHFPGRPSSLSIAGWFMRDATFVDHEVSQKIVKFYIELKQRLVQLGEGRALSSQDSAFLTGLSEAPKGVK